MDTMWFWPPVQVKEITTGYTYGVKSVQAAIEQMDSWPMPAGGKRGPKWRKADKVCIAALEGMAELADVRRAFEAAAAEAGVLRTHD